MAVEQPIARIVSQKSDIARFPAQEHRRVPVGPETAVGQDFMEVHSMKMHRMGKNGVVHDRQAQSLTDRHLGQGWAVDAPYGYFKDAAGLERSARMACALGCDGKWAIHPDQIDTINRVFTPSAEDIDRAGKILAAAEEARAGGKGAVAVEGRMVDQATVGLARRVWEQARALGLI